jgi:hypothetical protein
MTGHRKRQRETADFEKGLAVIANFIGSGAAASAAVSRAFERTA